MHTGTADSQARIVLGVCGSIACYKALEILRLLMQHKIQVQVIMTKEATKFVTPLSFATLSQNPVLIDESAWSTQQQIQHIELSKHDLFLIAPASANTISKLAHGIADNLLLASLLASQAPVLIAPAMNTLMYQHPLTQANLQRLSELANLDASYSYKVIAPTVGELACGVVGEGKMQEPEVIVREVVQTLTALKTRHTQVLVPKLKDKLVVVSAGATQLRLDPVRVLSNRSSGRMGYAIAEAARDLGARVVLISGPSMLQPPEGVELRRISTNLELENALWQYFPAADMLIQAAAVCDYQIPYSPRKLKKTTKDLQLILSPYPDILAILGARKQKQCLVGFAAETEDLIANAQRKLEQKNLDFILANDVSRPDIGIEAEQNMGYLLGKDGLCVQIEQMDKRAFAKRLLELICENDQR